jgi:hypothetical protein
MVSDCKNTLLEKANFDAENAALSSISGQTPWNYPTISNAWPGSTRPQMAPVPEFCMLIVHLAKLVGNIPESIHVAF